MRFFDLVALEPEALREPASVREAALVFGFSHGRLLVRLPKGWFTLVCGQWDLRDPVRTSAIDKLRKLQADALVPSDFPDSDPEWIANAREARLQGVVHEVVVANEAAGCVSFNEYVDRVADGDDKHSKELPHTPATIALACRLVIEVNPSIVLVDPYFDLQRESTASIFKKMVSWRLPRGSANFTVFCSAEQVLPEGAWDAECLAAYEARVRKKLEETGIPRSRVSLVVKVVKIGEQGLHDRYMLGSARGGIYIGPGFTPTGEKKPATVATLAATDISARRARFVADKHPFALVHEIVWP